MTATELLRALSRDGWAPVRQRGGHVQLKHSTKLGLVTVPRHADKTIPAGTLADILKDADLTGDELRTLL
ncbi:MAG: type II toxin-antitoxin system HicA family toxin [Chloroflexi bacterium]|nr:type II toxin-antitoxin system HicA family toxin [Chloroflexota bacterium]